MLDLLKIIPPYMVVFIGFMLSSAGAVIAAWGGLLHAQRQQAANLELFNQVTGGQSAVYVEPLRSRQGPFLRPSERSAPHIRRRRQGPEVVRRADAPRTGYCYSARPTLAHVQARQWV